MSPLSEYASPEKVAEFAREFSNKPFAPALMIAIFVASQLLFFPLVIMTLATAMVFGPVEGIFISLTGATISAAITYGIGFVLGKHGLSKMLGPVCNKIKKQIEGTGVVGMIALRFIPLAPYSIVNIALGVLAIPFMTYITASFLALLPGCLIRSFLGGAITDLWEKPDSKNLTIVGVGVLLWVLIVVLSQLFVRRWKSKQGGGSRKKGRLAHI
ncbi:MAG TPA: VTT domain-containing protein [Patescibacteria group bacterium]|nr:VTT domain-containing protein [Patescibacteria group bacterium]